MTESSNTNAVEVNGGRSPRWVPQTLAAFALGIAVGVWLSSSDGQAPRGSEPQAADRPHDQSEVLATVEGAPITASDFEAEVARRGGAANFQSLEARKALLDEMVRLEVLVARARRAGYDAEHDVSVDMKLVLAGRYREQHLEPRLREVTVAEDEIEDQYLDHRERFTIPAASRAAMLHFAFPPNSPETFRQRVRERASAAREEALGQPGNQSFGAVAVRYSDDQASRYRGGELGWLVEGEADNRLEKPVLEAVFALPPEGMSELIETDSGLYLLRVLEVREAQLRPLEEVAEAIRMTVQAEKVSAAREQFYADAARDLRVRVDEARLAAIQLPGTAVVDTEQRPPALPQS